MQHNMVGWFEVPVTDMDRARKFYQPVFDIDIDVRDFGGLLMGWFPFAEGKPGASGSLIKHADSYKPSETHGPLLYFSSTDVSVELAKIEQAGGKVLQQKTLISVDIGFMGIFIDSEGNRIALHSRK